MKRRRRRRRRREIVMKRRRGMDGDEVYDVMMLMIHPFLFSILISFFGPY